MSGNRIIQPTFSLFWATYSLALHVARSMALVLRLTATGASLVGIGRSFLFCAVRLAL